MKIAVVGTGYVGLSNAILLSQHHEVVSLDIVPQRVDSLNRRVSPITDVEIEEYLKIKTLNLKATLNKEEAYVGGLTLSSLQRQPITMRPRTTLIRVQWQR